MSVHKSEKSFRLHICRILLTWGEGLMGELVSRLMRIYRDRDAVKGVRVSGGSGFFRELVISLCANWDVKVMPMVEKKFRNLQLITIPEMKDRLDDLPLIVGYFIQDYMHRAASEGTRVMPHVKYVSHSVLWFLLTCDKWENFDELRAFIEEALRNSNEKVLTLQTALLSSRRPRSGLKGSVLVKAKEQRNWDQDREIVTELIRYPPWHESWNWMVEGYLGLLPAQSGVGRSGFPALATPISKVGQSLRNIHYLVTCPSACNVPEEEQKRVKRYFSSIHKGEIKEGLYNELGFEDQRSFREWTRTKGIDLDFDSDDMLLEKRTESREQLLPEQSVKRRPDVKKSKKRAQRATTIDAVKKQLRVHIRSARNHAFYTRDRGPVPELMKRPTMKVLASLVGVSVSSIYRAIHDPEDKEIPVLWETADNLDKVMKFKS